MRLNYRHFVASSFAPDRAARPHSRVLPRLTTLLASAWPLSAFADTGVAPEFAVLLLVIGLGLGLFALMQRRALLAARRECGQHEETLRVHELTERRDQEGRQRLWAKAFEGTRDGVIICDARSRMQCVNRAFTEITGYTAEDAIGQTPALLHSGRHDEAFYRELWAQVAAHGHWRGEIWNRRKDGEIYPEWLTISAVRDDAGAVTNYVGVFADITGAKRGEAELQRLAHYDPLTDLPNRRLLTARLEESLARTRRHGGRTALFFIDLDGFKTVNDSLGHPAGDELLKVVARRFKERVRAGDTLGRVGGDEFLVIAESPHGADEVAVLAQDLLRVVSSPMGLAGGHEVCVTASIGISLFPDDGCSDATTMIRDADAALYRAKEQGRNRFCFFAQDPNGQAADPLEVARASPH